MNTTHMLPRFRRRRICFRVFMTKEFAFYQQKSKRFLSLFLSKKDKDMRVWMSRKLGRQRWKWRILMLKMWCSFHCIQQYSDVSKLHGKRMSVISRKEKPVMKYAICRVNCKRMRVIKCDVECETTTSIEIIFFKQMTSSEEGKNHDMLLKTEKGTIDPLETIQGHKRRHHVQFVEWRSKDERWWCRTRKTYSLSWVMTSPLLITDKRPSRQCPQSNLHAFKVLFLWEGHHVHKME